MSDEKLSALIETLKKQGVESGESQGRQIIESAEKQAEEIISKAKAEAQSVIEKAQKEAELEMRRLESSMEISATKFIAKLKHSVEEAFLKIPIKAEVESDLADPNFFKKVLTEFVQAYAAQNPEQTAVQIRVPESKSGEIGAFALELMKRHYGKVKSSRELVIKDPNLKMGFVVELDNGRVRLDFTEEAFISRLLEFMTPAFRNFFVALKTGSQEQ
ncbi:MAG: V-type ATP synthase subunit E family protein [Pseudomonadota bacterium]